MGFEIEFDGFDEFQKEFEKKKKEAEGEVTLDKLLTKSFMERYRDYKDLDSFEDASDIDFSDPEEAIESEEWDSYVKENTSFSGWEEMITRAGQLYMVDKLKFD